MPDGPMSPDNEIKENYNPEAIPQLVAAKVEEYIVNGRPELNGRHELGMSTNVQLDHEPGSRAGFCGFAKTYGLEVAENLYKDKYNIACSGEQAEQFNKVDNSPSIYRRHGFNVVIDRNNEEWWLVDQTLNQFVNTNNGKMEMDGTGINIEKGISSNEAISDTASKLLEKGYVKLNQQTLAAYMTLMLSRGDSEKYDQLLKLFENKDRYIEALSSLVYKINIGGERVGNWDNVWNAVQDKLILQ